MANPVYPNGKIKKVYTNSREYAEIFDKIDADSYNFTDSSWKLKNN